MTYPFLVRSQIFLPDNCKSTFLIVFNSMKRNIQMNFRFLISDKAEWYILYPTHCVSRGQIYHSAFLMGYK